MNSLEILSGGKHVFCGVGQGPSDRASKNLNSEPFRSQVRAANWKLQGSWSHEMLLNFYTRHPRLYVHKDLAHGVESWAQPTSHPERWEEESSGP